MVDIAGGVTSRKERARDRLVPALVRAVIYLLAVGIVSTLYVFVVECLARGSIAGAFAFMTQLHTGWWATVLLVASIVMALDAIFGRSFQALCAFGPLLLLLPLASFEKLHYLSDPLFPADFLFVHQVVEIGPLLVRSRPFAAATIAIGVIVVLAFVACVLFRWRRHFPKVGRSGRVARLAVAVPALLFFYSISDYSTFSWARDRLQVIPMMWDQKVNYSHNGFIMAFALNVPMSKVVKPAGYGAGTMKGMQPTVSVSAGDTRPDVVVVMNESFWDPTLLPGVTITPDPMPTVRKMQSGWMFSPEFGGMTADIEFEALTGFSNAFLPYGSIPYQQDIRRPMPSLARYFKSQGYVTRAIHPYQKWFWNRANVYRDFGFDLFRSQENLPPIKPRGPLASDAGLTQEVIKEADTMRAPFFFFVVTLQNHGPYEPHRYAQTHVSVKADGLSEENRQSALSYAEGVHDADAAFADLVEWAKRRSRPTILVFFGDHLPPLGPVYVQTGFMKQNVAPRKAPIPDMLVQHRTPLVIWSNRKGTVDTGTISPSQIPREILELAGMSHPFYTGFLSKVAERYRVVDRQLLLKPDGRSGVQDWMKRAHSGPVIDQYRLLQYDTMFGRAYARGKYFPSMDEKAKPLMSSNPAKARTGLRG